MPNPLVIDATIGLEHGSLPPEPWGRKMRRAREDVAEWTLDEAAASIGRFYRVTGSTIARLEKLPEVPTDIRRRTLACVAVILYGLGPSEFGLEGERDLPIGLLRELVTPRRASISRVDALLKATDAVDPEKEERLAGRRGQANASSRCIELDRAA